MNKDKKKGFALIFTVLVSSIVLLIALGIFSISMKETTLSSISREAYIAFFAADSGVECAIYHDVVVSAGPGTPLNCAGQTVQAQPQSNGFSFALDVQLPDGQFACSEVSLSRSSSGEVQVISDGFNRSCSQSSALGEVQRSLLVNY